MIDRSALDNTKLASWHGLRVHTLITADLQFSFEHFKRSWFALVDAHRADELPAGLVTQTLCATRFEPSAHLMPRLLDMRALSDDQSAWVLGELDRAIADAEQPAVSALLRTTASPDKLAAHLRAAQSRRYGSQAAWLRVHDPYVFIQLPRVLGPRQTRALFGPIEAWTICLAGQWHTCTLQDTDETATGRAGAEDLQAPIAQGELWNALLRIGPVNRCLMQSRWHSLPEVIKHSGHIDALVHRAQSRHGLQRPADLAAFASFGADLAIEFDQHPLLRRVVERWQGDQVTASGDGEQGTLVEELEQLGPEVLAQLRTDCARTT